jgi:NADH:ubiquinone oxidoreductase subunit 5 (subunit L)/multisubunit Na+/H+ antiporter MnhA subunit
VNRIGDAALFSAIGLFFSISGSLDYSVNFMLLPYLKNMFFNISFLNLTEIGFLTLANSLLLVAIMAKSAQIGLHI